MGHFEDNYTLHPSNDVVSLPYNQEANMYDMRSLFISYTHKLIWSSVVETYVGPRQVFSRMDGCLKGSTEMK